MTLIEDIFFTKNVCEARVWNLPTPNIIDLEVDSLEWTCFVKQSGLQYRKEVVLQVKQDSNLWFITVRDIQDQPMIGDDIRFIRGKKVNNLTVVTAVTEKLK